MNVSNKKTPGIVYIKHCKRKYPDERSVYHLDDINHQWLVEGIIQLTWKKKKVITVKPQKSLDWDYGSFLSRSVVQQWIHTEG